MESICYKQTHNDPLHNLHYMTNGVSVNAVFIFLMPRGIGRNFSRKALGGSTAIFQFRILVASEVKTKEFCGHGPGGMHPLPMRAYAYGRYSLPDF